MFRTADLFILFVALCNFVYSHLCVEPHIAHGACVGLDPKQNATLGFPYPRLHY